MQCARQLGLGSPFSQRISRCGLRSIIILRHRCCGRRSEIPHLIAGQQQRLTSPPGPKASHRFTFPLPKPARMYPPGNGRCTREQKAFLSSSRAVRFNVEINTPRELSSVSGTHLETPPVFPGMPIFSATGAGSGVDLELLGRQIGGGWTRDGGASTGCGLPSAVLEDLEEVERACLQRASALKEEEQFVDTLGREDSPVAP